MNFFFSVLLACLSVWNYSPEIPHNEVERAFNNNDDQALVQIMKDKAFLKVLDKEGAFSKGQAKIILHDFFQKNPNGKFTYTLKGKSVEAGSFSMGQYSCKSQTYKVTLHFKKCEGSFLAETVKIE